MSKFFEYTDENGVMREAETFVTSDFVSTPTPNRPLMTTETGFLHPSLLDPQADVGIKPNTEYIRLKKSNILSKKFQLSQTPISKVSLIPEGGIPQRNGIDYEYIQSDNSVSWSSLGLENYMEENEVVEVSYFYR